MNATLKSKKAYKKIKTILIIPDIPKYMDLRNKIMNQQEYLGYISATTKEEDRPILFVKEVKTLKRKSDKKQFGYSIFTQSIGSGITSRFTLLNRDAKEYGELHKNDIIKCLDYEIKNSYFR